MKWFFALAFILSMQTAFAQNYLTVTGKVVLSETGEPLQGASVFAENTTLGTMTDADGNFKLYLPKGGYDIVVTFTGFQSESARVSSSQPTEQLFFSMKQRTEELGDVVVIASNEVRNGWEKYGDFFIREFIGQTANSFLCEIKNHEVLKFYYSKRRDRLKIKAEAPLIIENRALGYLIHYSLDSFTHDYGAGISFFTGNPYFEEMTTTSPVQTAIWNAAREDAYKGSILHFMRSLYRKQLLENGFEVQFVITTDGVQRAERLSDAYSSLRYNMDTSNLVEIKPFQPNIGVLYLKEVPLPGYGMLNPQEPDKFQFSILALPRNGSLFIEENGFYFDQTDVTLHGYYTWEKAADQLPYNFKTAADAEPVKVMGNGQ